MEELVQAINNLTGWVAVLCLIQVFHLLFKDTSGSYRLGKIEDTIKHLTSIIERKK
ncbi:MAG: hypothetical protein NC489_37090 [Ruminococcus flavefaciens]|nr:hypothetical protein [Ruminococcus flavefaciens]